MEQEVINKIVEEMSLCYESIGRKTPGLITIIAASLQDAIHFSSIEQVHEIFKRAKDIESIPTQKTLNECLKNYGEEWLKYEGEKTKQKSIEYSDPRSAWLPKDDIKKRINLIEAIKNYCDAIGGDMPYQYMITHRTITEKRGDKKVVKWENPEKVAAFDQPIKEYLRYLYTKCWRSIPIANGYPAEAKLNLGLISPSINEFKTMLKAEGVIL